MFAQRSWSGTSGLLAACLLTAFAIPAPAPAAPAPPAHAAAKQKKCKNPAPKTPSEKPPIYVRVTGVTCSGAAALARKVIVKAPKGCLMYTDARHIRLTSPCRVGGYRCTSRPVAEGMALEATCRRGAKAVRFQAQY